MDQSEQSMIQRNMTKFFISQISLQITSISVRPRTMIIIASLMIRSKMILILKSSDA